MMRRAPGAAQPPRCQVTTSHQRRLTETTPMHTGTLVGFDVKPNQKTIYLIYQTIKYFKIGSTWLYSKSLSSGNLNIRSQKVAFLGFDLLLVPALLAIRIPWQSVSRKVGVCYVGPVTFQLVMARLT